MSFVSSILAIVRVGSVPAPSDIISGREFLSILMKPTDGETVAAPKQQPSRSFRGLRKFRHFFYDQSNADDDTILPIEALFTSQEDLDRSSTRFYGSRKGGHRADSGSTATPATTTLVPTVGLVNDPVDPVTTSAPSWLVDGEPTTPQTEANGTAGESTTELTTPPEDISTVTVVGMSVEEEKATEMPTVRTVGRYAKRAKAIHQPVEYVKEVSPVRHSNAHRSELSVEERGPTISKEEQGEPDSAKGESSSVAKLVAPPGTISHQRYRTQRKQESNGGPAFQTVSYRDRKPADGSAWRDSNGEPRLESDRKAPLKSTREKPIPQLYSEPARFYSEPAQFYSEPAKVYSEPAKVYGEPEKVYSEPARVYSEPAKVYSEPAKIYSEPAKIYSEPAKIYSQPSSYWQTAYSPNDPSTTTTTTTTTTMAPTTTEPTATEPYTSAMSAGTTVGSVRLVFNELDKIPYDQLNAPTVDGDGVGSIHNAIGKFVPKQSHDKPEQQGDSQQEDGFAGQPPAGPVVQTLAPVLGSGDDSKVGYVVEGRNYRKYRVEEKTPDGFIVGEYGVLSHNDGNLRGVRYTADSDINPRLIYDALLKFLSL
uniref:Uncharacterized protein n=1 Tax=Anopheles stephensi TaxID=30069 RepID=A0A182YK17_ANOST